MNCLTETSFGTRLRLSTDRHHAAITRDIHAQHGVELAGEGLYALALAVRLDEAGAENQSCSKPLSGPSSE